MNLYDYYLKAAQDTANNDNAVVNKQQLFNVLSSKMPAFDGIRIDNLRASTFTNQSYKLDIDTMALSNAFTDLYGNTLADKEYMQRSIRSAYASTSVIITYYAALKSFSSMTPYYTNVFVPTVRNVQQNNNVEMIGTVLLNLPDVFSTVKGIEFSSDCDLRTDTSSAYMYKYSYDSLDTMHTASLTASFPTNKVSFVSFENFTLNAHPIAVFVDGQQLADNDYTVYYAGATTRIYFTSPHDASNVTITFASYLQEHMSDEELYKLQIVQKGINDFSLDNMYRMASNIYKITGISHLRNYLKSLGANVLPKVASFAFFDISNFIIGYAEFNSTSSLSYTFDKDIYGVRIFPEYPGILVNGTYSSRTFMEPIHADTLDVNVYPVSKYTPGNIGYIFALYR